MESRTETPFLHFQYSLHPSYFFQQNLVFLWKIIHSVKDKGVFFFCLFVCLFSHSLVPIVFPFHSRKQSSVWKHWWTLVSLRVVRKIHCPNVSCTHYSSLVSLFLWIFLSMKTNSQIKKARILVPDWIQKSYRIIESLRLEKTHRIIQSNHSPFTDGSR